MAILLYFTRCAYKIICYTILMFGCMSISCAIRQSAVPLLPLSRVNERAAADAPYNLMVAAGAAGHLSSGVSTTTTVMVDSMNCGSFVLNDCQSPIHHNGPSPVYHNIQSPVRHNLSPVCSMAQTQQFEIGTPESQSPNNQGLQNRTSETRKGFGLSMRRTPPKGVASTKAMERSPSSSSQLIHITPEIKYPSSPYGQVAPHMPSRSSSVPQLRRSSLFRRLLPVSVTSSADSPASAYPSYSPASAYPSYSHSVNAYPSPSHANPFIGPLGSSTMTHQPRGTSPISTNPWSCFHRLLRSSSATQLSMPLAPPHPFMPTSLRLFPPQQSMYGPAYAPPTYAPISSPCEPFTEGCYRYQCVPEALRTAPEQKYAPAPDLPFDLLDEAYDPFGFRTSTSTETQVSRNKEVRSPSKTPKKDARVDKKEKKLCCWGSTEDHQSNDRVFNAGEENGPNTEAICNC